MSEKLKVIGGPFHGGYLGTALGKKLNIPFYGYSDRTPKQQIKGLISFVVYERVDFRNGKSFWRFREGYYDCDEIDYYSSKMGA
jgi:hypothetical protein